MVTGSHGNTQTTRPPTQGSSPGQPSTLPGHPDALLKTINVDGDTGETDSETSSRQQHQKAAEQVSPGSSVSQTSVKSSGDDVMRSA